MRNWMDLNDDGQIDNAERMFAAELLCTSREEHIAFFGDAGDFDDADADDLDFSSVFYFNFAEKNSAIVRVFPL